MVDVLVGREEEFRLLHDEIVCGSGKMMVSAVGGLGKTELAKAFLAHKGQLILIENKLSFCLQIFIKM